MSFILFANKAVRTVLICLLLEVATYSTVQAQRFVVVAKGSKLEILTKGRAGNKVTFDKISGIISFDEIHFNKSSFDIAIKVNSLQCANGDLAKQMIGTQFFNGGKYPDIVLKSDSVLKVYPGGAVYTLIGSLAIKGIKNKVRLPFTATKTGNGYLFRGSFQTDPQKYELPKTKLFEETSTLFVELRTETSR